MEATAEKTIGEYIGLNETVYNWRNLTSIERKEGFTKIIRPRGEITIEFKDNTVYFTSYDKKGNKTYETSRKDYSNRSPRIILATEETNFIDRIKSLEVLALVRGKNGVEENLKENFSKKTLETQEQLEFQNYIDSLVDTANFN